MRVWISPPGKPELDGDGFILAGPIHRDCREIFQIDMGDWAPKAGWLTSQA